MPANTENLKDKMASLRAVVLDRVQASITGSAVTGGRDDEEIL